MSSCPDVCTNILYQSQSSLTSRNASTLQLLHTKQLNCDRQEERALFHDLKVGTVHTAEERVRSLTSA